jgi:hypothetical protein
LPSPFHRPLHCCCSFDYPPSLPPFYFPPHHEQRQPHV